ncbi:hypothetical protein HDR61_02170 [bacterium]|nr:hypothetical protein [bacterium]
MESVPENLFSGVYGAASSMFYGTFWNCTSLKTVPGKLFSGVSGASYGMFIYTFAYSGLESVPASLFDGVSGAAEKMFFYTFAQSRNLKSIPAGLFSGVNGAANNMFELTFYACLNLIDVPDGLFANVSGTAEYMFSGTFQQTAMTSIPENLFGKNISGELLNDMFTQTFKDAYYLTGPSARIDGKYLYEIWPNATADQAGECYNSATKLSDYDTIPDVWK